MAFEDQPSCFTDEERESKTVGDLPKDNPACWWWRQQWDQVTCPPGHLLPSRISSEDSGDLHTLPALTQALYVLVHCTQTWKPHKEKENAGYPKDGKQGLDLSLSRHLNNHARL